MANLTRICAKLKNHFLRNKYEGEFTLVSGTAPLELLDGQFFVIVNSNLNDGVFQNTAESLAKIQPETFTGRIWTMKVPVDFLELVEDIDMLNAKVEELGLLDKGYASESFGGYTYSLQSGAPAYMQEWLRRINSGMSMYQKIREDL
jgi:hypothetical protein